MNSLAYCISPSPIINCLWPFCSIFSCLLAYYGVLMKAHRDERYMLKRVSATTRSWRSAEDGVRGHPFMTSTLSGGRSKVDGGRGRG